jgi:hypothetical protein
MNLLTLLTSNPEAMAAELAYRRRQLSVSASRRRRSRRAAR